MFFSSPAVLRRLPLAVAALAALSVFGAGQAQGYLPLGGLALQTKNLRPGYVVTSAVYHPSSFIAQTYHVTQARLLQFGWRASYEVLFTRRDIGFLDEVGNKLDQYAGPNGAHWGYRVAVQNIFASGKYRAMALPTIGQESTGFIAASGAARGFIGVKFREGHFVADVAILPSNRQGSLLLLARTLDTRLRTFSSTAPVTRTPVHAPIATPTPLAP